MKTGENQQKNDNIFIYKTLLRGQQNDDPRTRPPNPAKPANSLSWAYLATPVKARLVITSGQVPFVYVV